MGRSLVLVLLLLLQPLIWSRNGDREVEDRGFFLLLTSHWMTGIGDVGRMEGGTRLPFLHCSRKRRYTQRRERVSRMASRVGPKERYGCVVEPLLHFGV